MRIEVHGIEKIDDLASDLAQIPVNMRVRAAAIVADNIRQGNLKAQAIARKAAGPHGKNYANRLTDEMTGPLSGEYGPEGPPKTDYVGVSGSAGAMRDLEKSAAQQAPLFARDAGKMLDDLFWPGG